MQGSEAGDAEESEELARFRQQWLEEVKRKKKVHTTQLEDTIPPADPPPSIEKQAVSHSRVLLDPPYEDGRPYHGAASTSSPASATDRASAAASFGPGLQRAVEFYRRAVEHEQRSDLDTAVALYRTAFRLDSNVHHAYQLVEDELQRKAAVAAAAKAAQHKKTSSTHSASAVDGLVHGLRSLDIAGVSTARVAGDGVVTGTLAKLIGSWPWSLYFEPVDEQQGVPIEKLSDELLLMILLLLDYATLERFARVDRKARVITLESSLWKPMVRTIYQPPQLTGDIDIEGLVSKYMSDYRRIYIEHPRVRYDGVYIALCHYIRSGAGENAWVNYSHAITYYRYLRFYPDGEVLSLLANDDLAPAQVVPILKPSLRRKGFSIGTWYLDGTTVHIGNLLEPDAEAARYAFQMVLDLRSRPVGRWNRIDFRSYDSVNLGSGEAVPLPLRHERSFWFSKVQSYAT